MSDKPESSGEAIRGFQGRYRFLSNFYPCAVTFDGVTYTSSEAAYQAAKTTSKEIKGKFATLNAREARRFGQSFPPREDWDDIKLNVMYRILREKFKLESMRSWLAETGKANLEEVNYWHDTFWGIYNGVGQNHLGRLLMVVRDEIAEEII